MFYKLASAENIYWWYDKVDQGPLKQVCSANEHNTRHLTNYLTELRITFLPF